MSFLVPGPLSQLKTQPQKVQMEFAAKKKYIVLRVTKINAHKLYVIHKEIWPSFYKHMLLDKCKFFKFSL
jgi:hypothetical protein